MINKFWSVLKGVVAALLALPFLSIAADVSEFQIGVSNHLGTNWTTYGQVKPAMIGLGVNSFRDEVFWHRLEAPKGEIKYPKSLEDLDRIVTESESLGIRPLIILNYGNSFYNDGDLPTTEASIAAFVNYARYVVRYFGKRVAQYEIWNEWNIGMGSPKKPRTLGSPSAYVNLLREVSRMIRLEAPHAQIIGGAIEGLDTKWIDDFIGLGGLKYIDVISLHPYVLQKAVNSLPETSIRWLDEVGLKLSLAGYSEMPIFVSEIGWPTNQGKYGVDEKIGAAYFARFTLLARARSKVKGVWWYTLVDSGNDSRNKEHRFGLLNRDLTPKPSFDVAKKIIPILRSFKVSEINVSPGLKAVLALKGQQRSVFVWAESDSLTANVFVSTFDLGKAAGIVAPASDPKGVFVGASPVEFRWSNNKLVISPLMTGI